MWDAECAVSALRARGELWEVSPGLVGLRGDALELLRRIEAEIDVLAAAEDADEWRVPPAIPLETLERADYFRSFPQWLTLAAHLRADDASLRHVAESAHPAAAARSAVAPAEAALVPAVCYHCYARHAGTTIAGRVAIAAQQICWRHEGPRLAPLERAWAFTMREIVVLGTPEMTGVFLRRGRQASMRLAASLGLDVRVAEAEDPFFAPTSRGRQLLQRVKGLKRELLAPIARGRDLAIASFNDHESFFGESFAIRLASGGRASSACIAFGAERWLLAVLVAHGPDARGWPDVVRHVTATPASPTPRPSLAFANRETTVSC